MKLAIMQPYLFPYAGYFKMASLVDKFVLFDDVQYIRRGWINRNRVLISGEARYITVPVASADSDALIHDIKVQPRSLWLKKMLTSIRQNYAKAPNFNGTFDLVRDVLDSESDSIADLARASVEKTSQRIGLDTRFSVSSGTYGNEHLSGSDRIIDICCREGAAVYVNLPGGKHLYNRAAFEDKGIELRFVDVRFQEYRQTVAEFVPGLSIIDMLMFNEFDEVKEML